MAEAEKAIILENLAFFKGNKSKTADSLGIGRKTIHRKLDDYLATDERESQE
jgi:DNA-binding NtrC family response regulator